MTPLQAACSQILNAAIEPDPAVETLRELLNTLAREGDRDECWQQLHAKLTRLRTKEPARMRHTLTLLGTLLDTKLDLDAIMAVSIPKAETQEKNGPLPFKDSTPV